MRIAIEMRAYGGPDVLCAEEREDWIPGPGEVVIATTAAGVNRADAFIRSGQWPIGGKFPYVPGLEVAGAIAAVGPDVTGFSPGDRVITMMQKLGGIHGTRAGGYQSHVLVPANTVAHLPEGLSLEDAAALGLPAVTALLALRVLDVERGHRVLVHAGSSAVGSVALQLLVARGAHAVATGTRPEKFEAVKRAGAREVVDTTAADWASRIDRVDRVFDLVGAATFGASVRALAPGGRLVFVGGTSGGDLAFSGWDLMKPVTVTGYSTEALTVWELQSAVNALALLHDNGAVRCLSLKEFPLRDAARAHEAMESGKLHGRVVLRL
jgi:NADPH:quinone reductase